MIRVNDFVDLVSSLSQDPEQEVVDSNPEELLVIGTR